ncbi:MAG: APC family permease [Eggerthellaceae bacterium]|jgi:APA family basic amino acid/polyamine antiporter
MENTNQQAQGNGNGEVKLAKSISTLGFFGLGLSAIFGASWLLTSGIWLDRAGGPINALIAFALCFIVELPLILAYYEATPEMPLAGGEMAYSYLTMGSFAGFIVGWFGVLVNIILCAWEALALSRTLSYLFPDIASAQPLYTLMDTPVTLPVIVIGLLLVIVIFFIQWRGAKLSANFGTVITTIVTGFALICVIIGIFNFDPANMQPLQTKDTVTGSLSLLAMLPFSVAGWETVAKGAQEASRSVPHKKIGAMLVLAVFIAIIMYILTMIIPTGLVPWQTLTDQTAPFAYAMTQIGLPVLGTLLITVSVFGVIGVYNAVFFGATRMLYQLGDIGLVPRAFSKLHPKYKSPTNCIILVSVIAAIVPFLGQGMFVPLIDVSAVAYIVLWGSTLLSVMIARKKWPDLRRPAKYPGGKPLMYFGVVVAVVLLCLMILPGTPASIQWPVEYITLAILIIIGLLLYAARDKSVPKGASQERLWAEIEEQQKLNDDFEGEKA